MSHRCLVVAEIAQAHDGSLGNAHAYIDAAAKAGADAVKFQCHIASAESTPAEPWRVKFSYQDASRYDYWKRMEFTADQWAGLKQHCDSAGVQFICSPFSVPAVQLIHEIGVPCWKVASGEVLTPDLFQAMVRTKLPMVVSTGMSSWTEIDQVVNHLRAQQSPFTLLQCTSAYPCPPDRIGLNVMEEFSKRYGCPVGLSDHSGSPFPGIAAATLGASFLEVHVTWSKDAFGPDVPSSLTFNELSFLVEGVRTVETILDHPVNKDEEAKRLEGMKSLFGKSLVAIDDLPAGHTIERCDLVAKKPGSGIAAARLEEVLGRKLNRLVKRDELLMEDAFEAT